MALVLNCWDFFKKLEMADNVVVIADEAFLLGGPTLRREMSLDFIDFQF